ncbi:MAG: hypothetical protein M3Y24_03760 [Acidobacteriota bacterium]|nr:hypothetical protein [Acidobacteriota bacterium]
MKLCSPLLSTLLVPLVTISPLLGQLPAPGPAADSISTPALQLRVVEGVSSSAPGSGPSGKSITVEVTDEAGSRVANAAVVFRLPESGSTAAFQDGTYTAIVYTDAAGRARVSDIQWGNGPGPVALRITTAKGTLHAGLMLEQTITPAQIPTANAPARIAMNAPMPIQPQAAPKPQPLSDGAAVSGAMPRVTIEHLSSRRSAISHSVPPRAVGDYGSSEAPGETPKPIAAIDADTIDANVPLRHLGTAAEAGEAPGFSITSDRAAPSSHSKKKWLIALAVAAGAGAALAVMKEGKSGTTAASGVSIGAPTISVGHP